LRKDIRSLPPAKAEEFMKRLGDDAADDWVFRARDAQLPPPDLGWGWLFLGGRGTGKSHSMSAAVHMAVRAGISRIHLIAPTTADFHDVNLEGRSGILATCGRDPRPRWVSSKRRLEWPNGAVCVCFSGEEPESLRGPQCELCVIDEIARMRYQQAVFDTMMLGLRLGDQPRVLIATTPRTTPFMKKLIAMTGVSITTGSTYDNVAHLSPEFLKKVRELYEGTRLGRQELQGAMILDPQNALFKDDWLVHDEVAEDLIEQVTVGVDPSDGADEVGISTILGIVRKRSTFWSELLTLMPRMPARVMIFCAVSAILSQVGRSHGQVARSYRCRMGPALIIDRVIMPGLTELTD
jgi:phage terminase large subunit-like protein